MWHGLVLGQRGKDWEGAGIGVLLVGWQLVATFYWTADGRTFAVLLRWNLWYNWYNLGRAQKLIGQWESKRVNAWPPKPTRFLLQKSCPKLLHIWVLDVLAATGRGPTGAATGSHQAGAQSEPGAWKQRDVGWRAAIELQWWRLLAVFGSFWRMYGMWLGQLVSLLNFFIQNTSNTYFIASKYVPTTDRFYIDS